ncbi:hypothetical protein GUITHDRAFT_142096 [Guillardia theta CCMP2712]|uniref:Ion transport domain-containing protein n=1 Tax=Guillardia theta (strain CCMP2712) TaxID=905079 RepID=L1IZS8_GUITC|nr:hypothetical protein GUITHDRAFT_142096 [Guillardia theta CCMP2712]EKX41414.1 hypothetical protein GUITHDRAFT_142096 [Guillardia theta CCMP2712]|eukprot:XP_005828394.1 hypothetical protein GUITHDRAFT_142096 [Guillardia theta CCMP2712]
MSWWRDDGTGIMKGEVMVRRENDNKTWSKKVKQDATCWQNLMRGEPSSCRQHSAENGLTDKARHGSAAMERASAADLSPSSAGQIDHVVEGRERRESHNALHRNPSTTGTEPVPMSTWPSRTWRRVFHSQQTVDRYEAFLTCQNLTIHPNGNSRWRTSVKHVIPISTIQSVWTSDSVFYHHLHGKQHHDINMPVEENVFILFMAEHVGNVLCRLYGDNYGIRPRQIVTVTCNNDEDAERWSGAIRRLMERQESLPRPTGALRFWQNRCWEYYNGFSRRWLNCAVLITYFAGNVVEVVFLSYFQTPEEIQRTFTQIYIAFSVFFTFDVCTSLYSCMDCHRVFIYLSDFWNVFDIVMVSLSWASINYVTASSSSNFWTAMPLIRTIRLLKMVDVYRGFGYIVHAIRMAVPEMGSTLLVTVMVYGIFAILVVNLFAADSPRLELIIAFTLLSLVSAVLINNFLLFKGRMAQESCASDSKYIDLQHVAKNPLYQVSLKIIQEDVVGDQSRLTRMAQLISDMWEALRAEDKHWLTYEELKERMKQLDFSPPVVIPRSLPPSFSTFFSSSGREDIIDVRGFELLIRFACTTSEVHRINEFCSSKEKSGDLNVFKLYFLHALNAVVELGSIVRNKEKEEGKGEGEEGLANQMTARELELSERVAQTRQSCQAAEHNERG